MKLRSTISKDGSIKTESEATDDFLILSTEECGLLPALGKESTEIFSQLEADLLVQLKVTSSSSLITSPYNM